MLLVPFINSLSKRFAMRRTAVMEHRARKFGKRFKHIEGIGARFLSGAFCPFFAHRPKKALRQEDISILVCHRRFEIVREPIADLVHVSDAPDDHVDYWSVRA